MDVPGSKEFKHDNQLETEKKKKLLLLQGVPLSYM